MCQCVSGLIRRNLTQVLVLQRAGARKNTSRDKSVTSAIFADFKQLWWIFCILSVISARTTSVRSNLVFFLNFLVWIRHVWCNNQASAYSRQLWWLFVACVFLFRLGKGKFKAKSRFTKDSLRGACFPACLRSKRTLRDKSVTSPTFCWFETTSATCLRVLLCFSSRTTKVRSNAVFFLISLSGFDMSGARIKLLLIWHHFRNSFVRFLLFRLR